MFTLVYGLEGQPAFTAAAFAAAWAFASAEEAGELVLVVAGELVLVVVEDFARVVFGFELLEVAK